MLKCGTLKVSSYSMMKRPKVINISLTTPKHPTPIIHHEPQLVPTTSHQLLPHCCQVLALISEERLRQTGISLRQGILFPWTVIDSMQTVLKEYVVFKTEAMQEQLRTRTSKHRLPREKGWLKLCLGNKENVQEVEEREAFRTVAQGKAQWEKLQARVTELQSEASIWREKLKEKNEMIAKLLSREMQLRRKYSSEVGKFKRNRNIYNISLNHEDSDHKQLNISGRHLNQEDSRKPTPSHDSQQATHQPFISQPINMRAATTVSNFTPLPRCAPQMDLQSLLKVKERAVDELNENNYRIEKYLEQIDEEIGKRKDKERRSQKKTTEVLKIDDEDFETLQMEGFYRCELT